MRSPITLKIIAAIPIHHEPYVSFVVRDGSDTFFRFAMTAHSYTKPSRSSSCS